MNDVAYGAPVSAPLLFCASLLLSIGLLLPCPPLTFAAGVSGEPLAGEAHNLLANGDFRLGSATPAEWLAPDGASRTWDSALPGWTLRVQSSSGAYLFARQDFAVDGDRARQLAVSALVRFTGVRQGANAWDKARIHLTFHDGDGKQLGGWPELGLWAGDGGWRWYNRTFALPPGTRRVSLYAGLHNASGAVFFGHVIAAALDAAGKPLPRITASSNDTSGWIPFAAAADDFQPTAVDMSRLLEKPAGRHGFVTVRDGRLAFTDGAPARFLGVNIVASAAFPDKGTAEVTARRLAKFGVNMVRFHHMDAPWTSPNIFDRASGDTRRLSPASLDRLDYFIHQLRRNGIYVFMDLLVHRKFLDGDGVRDAAAVENGAKVVAHFDPRLIELQMEYATQLLTHHNPYTGLRYVDDPVIAVVDVINESSLLWPDGLARLPASYAGELDAQFNTWLLQRYGDRSGLATAWGKELAADEDPGRSSVRRAALTAAPSDASQRLPDTMRFYVDVEAGHFTAMRHHLRQIGLKVPVVGSNHWERRAADLVANAAVDVIDRHAYWDHPQGGFGDEVGFNNTPALKDPEGGLLSGLARSRVAGRPFTTTEWQYSWPNEYILEGPLATVSYGMLQGWDALLQFDFASAGWEERISGNFNIGNKPGLLGQWPAIALMFHRGDLNAALRTYRFPMTADQVWAGSSYDLAPAWLPLVSRTEIALPPAAPGGGLSSTAAAPDLSEALQRVDRTSLRYTSDTGELVWDGQVGLLTVNSRGTQGVVGFAGRFGSPIELADVRVRLHTPFASLIVSSLEDNRAIRSARHLLVTAVARAENSGTVYNPTRTRLQNAGRAPILMEPVVGALLLRGRSAATVYALDGVGHRQKIVPVSVTPDGVEVPLTGQAPIWYEVVLP